MQAVLPLAWSERVSPRCANMSSILPTATTSSPARAMQSSMVSPGIMAEKSRRLPVRTKAPGLPVKGRAMTRPTHSSPVSSSRAMRQ